MLQTIYNWPWAGIWAAISAIFTAATACIAFWAMHVWRHQEALKAKMSLKTAVAEYANALSQLPVNLPSPQIRIELRAKKHELRHKLNAVMNAFLVCENMLEKYPQIISCCSSLPEAHKGYVRGSKTSIEARDICRLILSQRFVFK